MKGGYAFAACSPATKPRPWTGAFYFAKLFSPVPTPPVGEYRLHNYNGQPASAPTGRAALPQRACMYYIADQYAITKGGKVILSPTTYAQPLKVIGLYSILKHWLSWYGRQRSYYTIAKNNNHIGRWTLLRMGRKLASCDSNISNRGKTSLSEGKYRKAATMVIES